MNFERFFIEASTLWEPCLSKTACMKNITQFPSPASAASDDIVVLACQHQMHFDPSPLMRLFAERDVREAEEIVCRLLEDIAMRLDRLQQALAAHEFDLMGKPAERIGAVAEQIGLTEVAVSAGHVFTCLVQQDGIALDATMARLERGFDLAVTEVWNFRDL